MTLHILRDLEQGSAAWLEARLGIVTASVMGQLITPATKKPANNPQSRAIVAQLAAERITGWVDDSYASGDMERGWDDEPRAVEEYEKRTGKQVEAVGFMVREEGAVRVGYSPDGLVEDDGLIECKSRRPKKHLQTILAGTVPTENIAQIQTGLYVSGRAWCDYLSYCGGMPMWIVRVHPDPAWFAAIETAAAAFESAVEQMTDDYLTRVDGLPLTERTPDYANVELKL